MAPFLYFWKSTNLSSSELLKTKTEYYNFSSEELEKLLSEAVNGNSDSFNKISSAIRSIAFSYFKSKYNYGKLKSIDDAEDLANNVFLSFAEQYQNIDKIENWLRRVMFLTFVNWYKKENSKNVFEFNENIYNQHAEQDFSVGIDAEKVQSIILQLKDPKDKIIRMRFWQGLKFSEIAEKLGRNEPAIKKMFYRTLEEIKEKLK